MQCLSEVIYCCDAASDISFTAIMAEEVIKVVPAIYALLGASDPLFSCLSHKVIIQELMHLPCI